MKKRWIFMGLLLSMLCLGGCTKNKKIENNMSVKQHETETNSETVENTELEPGIGEGTSSMELGDLSGSLNYKLGQTIAVSVEGQEYELQIDSAMYMKEKEDSTTKVVVIDYTYRNLGENPLLIGDIRFQLADREKTETYEPYYSSKLTVAEPVEKGESMSAQVAFTNVSDSKEFVLVYTETASDDIQPVCISIDEIGNAE